jgi:hypothetical protein
VRFVQIITTRDPQQGASPPLPRPLSAVLTIIVLFVLFVLLIPLILIAAVIAAVAIVLGVVRSRIRALRVPGGPHAPGRRNVRVIARDR